MYLCFCAIKIFIKKYKKIESHIKFIENVINFQIKKICYKNKLKILYAANFLKIMFIIY